MICIFQKPILAKNPKHFNYARDFKILNSDILKITAQDIRKPAYGHGQLFQI